jgi:poly(3-hydroxybutyrate) depolymerase
VERLHFVSVYLVLFSLTDSSWLTADTARAGSLIEFPNVSEQWQPRHLLGYIVTPEGPRAFPAVVVLHGCNGFSPASAAIAGYLKSLGYVALAVATASGLVTALPNAVASSLSRRQRPQIAEGPV